MVLSNFHQVQSWMGIPCCLNHSGMQNFSYNIGLTSFWIDKCLRSGRRTPISWSTQHMMRRDKSSNTFSKKVVLVKKLHPNCRYTWLANLIGNYNLLIPAHHKAVLQKMGCMVFHLVVAARNWKDCCQQWQCGGDLLTRKKDLWHAPDIPW